MINHDPLLSVQFQIHPVPIGVSRGKFAGWLASFIIFFSAMVCHTAAHAGPGNNGDSMQQIRDFSGQYDKSSKRINLSWKLADDAGIEIIRVSYSVNGKDFTAAGMVWTLPHGNDEYLFRQAVKGKNKNIQVRLTDEKGNTSTIQISTR